MQTNRSGLCLLRLLAVLAVVIVAAPAVAGDPDRTGPAERVQADGPAQLAQACPRIYRPVCAFVRGNWRTYSNSCVARNAGARLIRQGACRASDNGRVCCQRGRREFFSSRRECRRAGGRIVPERFCRADNRQICCQRGRREFFSSRRECRRAGGRPVSEQFCRRRECRDRRPVCGWWRGQRRDFRDICELRRNGGRFIRYGRCRAPQTCHQRGTSRRFDHIRGRSWHPACRNEPPRRTCHQRGTSRNFPHIRGRSWHPACGGAGTGGGGAPPKPRAGTPCTGKDRHGATFQGRIVVDRNGIASCMSNVRP